MRRQAAFTLLEVLVTIVVISIAAVALLSVYTNLVRSSADPAIQQQATTIAEAYLEEIMLRPFNDPQGGESGSTEGESGRAEYDDVKDYRALPAAAPAADQFGNAIPALADYDVTVTITNEVLAGPPDVPSDDSLRIDVRVDHPAITSITLSAYRTNYCPNPALC